jgi:hypothetical protein
MTMALVDSVEYTDGKDRLPFRSGISQYLAKAHANFIPWRAFSRLFYWWRRLEETA